MASKIKDVSKFSEDAITIAVNKLLPEEKHAFLNGLKRIVENLGEKEPNETKKKKKITDESIFSDRILPQIRERISKIEAEEMEQHLKLPVKFDIQTSFDTLSISELKTEHSKIVRQEEHFQNATLLVQFFRGQLYLSLKGKVRKENIQWKKFVEEEIDCSYMTVLRYMTLACVIISYPRLLLCNVTFAQILKHRERICKYLESEAGMELQAQLSMSFDLKVQEKAIHIGSGNISMPPKQKFGFNPDWEHLDRSGVEVPNKNTERWIESVGASGTGNDCNEMDSMERYLRLVLYMYVFSKSEVLYCTYFCSCVMRLLSY
jgi:hypothetical protein